MRLTAVSDSVVLLGAAFWTLLSLVRPRAPEPGNLPACTELGSAPQKGACRSQDGPLEAVLRPGQPKWNQHGGPATIPILCATEPLNPTGAAAYGLGSAAFLSSASGLQSPAISRSSSRFPIQTGRTGRRLGAAGHVVEAPRRHSRTLPALRGCSSSALSAPWHRTSPVQVDVLLSHQLTPQEKVAVCQPGIKRLLMTYILHTENWINNDTFALRAFFGSGNKFYP